MLVTHKLIREIEASDLWDFTCTAKCNVPNPMISNMNASKFVGLIFYCR